MTASAAEAAKAKAEVAVAVPAPAPTPAQAQAPPLALSDLARRATPMERRDAQLVSADLQSWAECLFNHSQHVQPQIELLVTALDRPRRDLHLEMPNVCTYAQTLVDRIDELKTACAPLGPINDGLRRSLELATAQVARGAAAEKRRDAARELARDGLQKLRATLTQELAASKALVNAQHHKNVLAIQQKHGRAPASALAQPQPQSQPQAQAQSTAQPQPQAQASTAATAAATATPSAPAVATDRTPVTGAVASGPEALLSPGGLLSPGEAAAGVSGAVRNKHSF